MDPLDFNFAHSLSLFAGTSKSGEVLETQEFVLVNNKVPVAEFNQAYLKRPDYKLARALERVIDHYARSELPFTLHARKGSPELVEELLVRGFTARPDLPCMELDASAVLPHPAPGLRVRNVAESCSRADPRASTARTLADFRHVAFESFGYPAASAGAA